MFALSACSTEAERQEVLKNYEDSAPAACDRSAAQAALVTMSVPQMLRVSESKSGGVIVHFGSDYRVWTPSQRQAMATTFANTDACIHGAARTIEFQSPGGDVIGRADKMRGIRMTP